MLPRVRCFSRNRQAPPAKRVLLDLGFSQGDLTKMRGARHPKVNAALGELEGVGAIGRRLDRLSREPAKLAKIARQDDV
jgi:CRP/FNR family transcriptional regulator, cyclic AMP receptor protein